MEVQDFREQHKLDIATVLDGEIPQLVTEGLTDAEMQMEETKGPGNGWSVKAKRELAFPLSLLEKGYALDVSTLPFLHDNCSNDSLWLGYNSRSFGKDR